jgi:signal transduction histidine kinase
MAEFPQEIKAGDRRSLTGRPAVIRASRAEMSRENLDPTTLVELLMSCATAAPAVECRVDPGINAWGDVRLMMTVLRNLFGNAWKFTARNASAAIRCDLQERDGRNWICVTDDGAGFDMAQATRLFKPFTRLHRQDEFSGYGMGLATAYRIVKRHGGEIEAESQPGQGTVVRFWLPRAD